MAAKYIWKQSELDEWKGYCRDRAPSEFPNGRPFDCRELVVVPHRMFIEWTDQEGRTRLLPLQKGDMVCRSPFDQRCGIKPELKLSSDGTIRGYCVRKHTPIKFRVTGFDGLFG